MSLTTGWSNSQITANTLRVLRHLADYMTSHPGQAPGAADLAADLGIEVHQVSHAFDSLRERGLVQLAESLAPEATAAFLQPSGVEAAEAGRARRESTNTRRAACRAALLDWMDRDDDSFGPYVMEFLHDPRAWYYGEKFTEADVRRSAATLRDNGLMQSVDSAQEDFLRTKITEAGRDCLGRFNGDIGAWSDPAWGDAGAEHQHQRSRLSRRHDREPVAGRPAVHHGDERSASTGRQPCRRLRAGAPPPRAHAGRPLAG